MQTDLHPQFKDTAIGNEADAILRSCVHCGFCTATCPTYQELGDERDGPRGRIYLIKQLLETGTATEKTRTHLDRCLNCRSCETTCPSGVEYGRLVDIGKEIIERQQSRPLFDRLKRWGLRKVLPYESRFTPLLKIGQFFKLLLPTAIGNKIPAVVKKLSLPQSKHQRKMLLLDSCGQPGATPNTNIAAIKVMDRLGVSLLTAPNAGCCGAVSYHLSEWAEGLDFMRRNIDAWWPQIEEGVEAIVITASGCGTMVQDYGKLLKDDPLYKDKALRVSELAKDLAQVITPDAIEQLGLNPDKVKTAIHCPCTLQHAMQLPNAVDQILEKAGFELTMTNDKHLCCGSAGTYSILQPKLSNKLLDNKLTALTLGNPQRIVTANIGCQLHLATKANIPVQHWVELIDQSL